MHDRALREIEQMEAEKKRENGKKMKLRKNNDID